ncbi:AAA family ATPase [Georhizobium sp. MAB10]|uniref:AAA family ATPase n=1 Tax=Georhizobium sp. MAB10 TaxID=3028319 RepID=UPI0038557D45
MLDDTDRRRKNDEALAAENALAEGTRPAKRAHKGLMTRFQFDLELVERHLRETIVGQDEAIAHVLDSLRIVCADIGDPRRPLTTTLFLGPTGVGKTELVRSVARAIHGDADAVCRIDMNTLSQEHYAAALTGAPPGYVGSKEGTTILDQEKIEGSHGRPGIVLFDELEKASDEVVLALLNVFDNGMLTVASGERTYSFRNALVFMTSNLATREIQALDGNSLASFRARLSAVSGARSEPRLKLAHKALLKRFPPEFVNRIDHIEVFNPITPQHMDQLVEVELSKLNRRIAKHQCRVVLHDDARAFLAKAGYDQRFGARGLRRALRKHVEVALAKFLLDRYVSSAPDQTLTQFRARLIENQRIDFEIDNQAG